MWSADPYDTAIPSSCPDYPRRHSPLKFCVRGHVSEKYLYISFHENRSMGLGAVGVENRPLPLTWPMAYSTARTTGWSLTGELSLIYALSIADM